MERIIVTGGAGFIGSNLVRRLQEDNPSARLLVIDDFRTGTFSNLVCEHDGFSFRGDVLARSLSHVEWPELTGRFRPDVIFHLAAITDTTVTDQAKMITENVEPFRLLLDATVRSGVKLVWASSAATYGTGANGASAARRPFALQDAGRPANVYGFSKWVMENLHRRTLSEHPDAHIVGLRYFNVFGPGEQNKARMASMILQLTEQMLSGKRPRIFFDGQQARDQVYVTDAVGATVAAARTGSKSGIYNVGSGEATTFNQIVSALNDALRASLEPDYFENPYSFYQSYTCADLSQTKAGLGWEPTCAPRESIMEYARLVEKRREKPCRG